MKHTLNLLGLSIFTLVGASLSHANTTEESPFSSPESVLHHGNHLFVSNVGKKLEPTNQDGDGFISMLSSSGELITQKHFEVILNAPKGMAVHNNTLYVTDINRVVGLDLDSKKQVMELSLADLNVNFLNDIVATDDGILYVSATDTGDIYQINTRLTDTKRALSRLPIQTLPGPNGLAYDKESHALWVASFGSGEAKPGEFGKVSLNSYQYEKLASIEGMLDGVALISANKALLSDWVAFDNSGRIIEVDLTTGEKRTLYDNLGGPADFSYLAAKNEIVIPRMIESKVTIQTLD